MRMAIFFKYYFSGQLLWINSLKSHRKNTSLVDVILNFSKTQISAIIRGVFFFY